MVDQIIRPADLPNRANPNPSEKIPVDNGSTVGGATVENIVLSGRPTASQLEAEAGTDALKAMTPLTTKQAIYALGDPRFATAAQGMKADTALQSVVQGMNIVVDATDPLNPIISAPAAAGLALSTNRASLKAINPDSVKSVYLSESGREGEFNWFLGDFSARVSNDPGEGIYIKANSYPSSVGAWVRTHDGEYLAKWFGAKGDGVSDDSIPVQQAINLCLFSSRPTPLVLTGQCRIVSPLFIDRPVGTASGAETFFIRGAGPFAGFVSGLLGDIIDSNLPYIAPFNDPPSCNITFEHITWVGDGTLNPRCVSGKFLKVRFNHNRFNVIRAVQSGTYIQSWYFYRCSMIATVGNFVATVGRLYDLRIDQCDFESCANGVKSFEDGVYGGSITNNLFQNSGQFFAQAGGYGLVISGNYTEANSAPDYQLSDAVNYPLLGHHGTQFTGNFLAIASGYRVIVGNAQGMMAGGNSCYEANLYDTTNTASGTFKSVGDNVKDGTKFSTIGQFDGDGAGNFLQSSVPSTSPISLVSGAPKTITAISVPAGDWDLSGVIGYIPGGATSVTRYQTSISSTANASGPEGSRNTNVFAAFVSGGFAVSYPTPVFRVTVAATTTFYLVGFSDFTAGAMSAYGEISARRAGGR